MSSENAPETTAPQLITLGCRLNAYESEVMRRHASEQGLGASVIVNTCAVTAEAVRQARQTIRRARRDNPDARIIVTGCAAQTEPETFADMPEVDHVVGNHEKMQPETFAAFAADGANSVPQTERIQVNDIMSVRETAGHLIDGFATRSRAYVQVQNGCDHRCTFCIIPYGRGNSRSVPAGEVVDQIRRLVDRGIREVVLTGVDMTSYGPDLPGNMSLGQLVQKILHLVPGLDRLRLSSIDSIEADDALLDAIRSEQRLLPHLHLSLQAGDNMILKRMKRRHAREDSIRFCADIRTARPDMAFGADLIAGFPTETEDMFSNTLDLVDACDLTWLHVFPFSPRKGTPAARMPQLSRTVVKERAAHLRAKGDTALNRFLSAQHETRQTILMEKANVGRTAQFAEVHLPDGDHEANSYQDVVITGHDGRRLIGKAACEDDKAAA